MLATNVIHFTRIFAMPGYYWARAKPPFALSVAKGLMQVRPFATLRANGFGSVRPFAALRANG